MTNDKVQITKAFLRKANWFVIAVRDNSERTFAEHLQEQLGSDKYVVFVPTKSRKYKRKKTLEYRKVTCFKGYVFVVANVTQAEAFIALAPIVRAGEASYKLLANDEFPDSIALSAKDKALLTTLMNDEFNIPAIEAIRKGDKVVVMDSVLEGFGGRVVKVDIHNLSCDIEFELGGKKITETLGLEIVERVES
jgi:transcription antitermination factor NusG